MRIVDCIQGSPDWWAARRGIPTASEMGSVLTPRTMKLAAASETYIHRLIADRLDPLYPRLSEYATPAMKHGTQQEPESRAWYAMERGVEVRQVGFCLTDDGRFGASPDALVGDDGVLECKNPQPSTMVEWLLAGTLPDQHKGQVHGLLVVTGRAWVDFLAYCPGLPPFLLRVTPDEYTERLREALESFWGRYQTAWLRIQALAGEQKGEAA